MNIAPRLRCRRAVRPRIVSSRSFSRAMARFAEAKTEADRACDVDPLCLSVATSAAWVRYVAGDHHAAIDRCRHVLDMDSEFTSARRILGAALLGAGKPHEAVSELTSAAGPDGDDHSFARLARARQSVGRIPRRSGRDGQPSRLVSRALLRFRIPPRTGAYRTWQPRQRHSICSPALAPTAIHPS